MAQESALLNHGGLHREELVVVPIWAVRNRDVIVGGVPPNLELAVPGGRGKVAVLMLLRSELAAELDGVRLKLRPQEYFVLEHLALRPGETCDVSELAAVLSGSRTRVPTSRVREVVHHIRRVLGDQPGRSLRTVQQRGYVWVAVPAAVDSSWSA